MVGVTRRMLGVATMSLAASVAQAEDPASSPISSPAPSIIVTAPGGTLDADDSVSMDGRMISASGTPDMFKALTRNIAGVSLQNAQDNPFQPNLIYHGYTASPLQGNAQGLAFYLDGGRFNQPFGETVQFDLLPEAAIDTITIKDASPVYGLNALGGAIVVATKTGRSFQGLSLTGAGGNYGIGEGSAEAGWQKDGWSAYAAVQESHDAGWRRHSPSTLYNGYADLGYDGDRAGLHVKLVGADSNLAGIGSSPVELLAADYRGVFTYPDGTRNRFGRVSLHPWVALSDATRIEASLYAQHLRQKTVNGDNSDVDECDDQPGQLCLQNDDDSESPLLDTHGNQIPTLLDDDGAYGVLNRSTTSTTAGGALVQLEDKRALFGGTNIFTIGASYDASATSFRSATELGVLTDTRDVLGLGPIIEQPDGSITPVSLEARTRYSGFFLSDTLPLGARLTAELGLRYNIARIILEDRIGTDLDGSHRFTRLNPGAQLDYKLSDAISLRAGYAETNRAPTPAELSCAGPDDPCSFANFFVGDPALKQVVAKSWEAGASGHFTAAGWRFDWQLSGYRTTNHNDIQFIASDVRGRAYFQNIGQTRRQGADASLAATRGRWTAKLGYAFTDATYRNPLTLNSPDNPDADDDGTISVVRGDRLPGIPRHRGTFSVDYTGDRFTVGGDVQAQTGQYLFGDEANLEPRTAGFAVVDLRGSIRLFGPIWAFGEISNLFDRHYATYGTFSETDEVYLSEAPGATDPRSLSPAAPRRWKAGLRARF
jgi:outer membrane receptor protein involved in Fe transport